ncbi:hypothetical protein SSS_09782 [Sarcoptes scabiei]|nr:hypothetical protein SSS_09782 [Sarcoptes scabiei]
MTKIFNDKALDLCLSRKDLTALAHHACFNKKYIQLSLAHQGIRKSKNNLICCVICNKEFKKMDPVFEHIEQNHHSINQMLRQSHLRPIVGLDNIEEYRNEKNQLIEYRCNLCNLYYCREKITWHILSYYHKEQFFKFKFPKSPLIQIEPIEQRRMEMDRFLMEYDKRNDRGNLVRKTFTKGMIQKSQARQFDYRLNLEYIKNLYPSEGRRLYHLLSVNAQPKLLVPMKKGFAIDLKTEEDFEDGKNLLQRINESLLEFTDTFEENKF